MTRSLRFTLFTLALAALAACGEAPPAAAGPAKAAAKKKAEAESVVAAAQIDYVYSPINKRDPFRGLQIADKGPTGGPVGPVEAGCTEPLCLIDTDELMVVGVVSGDANPLAMVEDRTGVGHIVRRNTRVGKQGGKVTQILRDCIVVTSFITGGADGKPQANKQNMCVKTDSRSVEPLDLLKGKEFTQ
jgi:type IV pilus assembly protein PilP